MHKKFPILTLQNAMWLQDLQLFQFKNYEEFSAEFTAGINCFVGPNGSGKTNLLEAIHYLCLAKSAFNYQDGQAIGHAYNYATVQGSFQKVSGGQQVYCAIQQGQSRKVLKLNGVPYERLMEHVGAFPLVMIAPHDTDLIREGSEWRRKFFDNLICQLYPQYLRSLLLYNQALKKRNMQLRLFEERRYFDADLLEAFDRVLLAEGAVIYGFRCQVLDDFMPLFEAQYRFLSEQKEQVQLRYQSQLHSSKSPEVLLREALPKDRLLQRSTVGLHKDDFDFEIDGFPLKKFASQGQQKSFVVALKLATFECLQKQKDLKPLLLLDDIFDKLDQDRIKKLMQLVSKQTFGQIFLTDAHSARSRHLMEELALPAKIFEVQAGKIHRQYGI